MVAAIISGKAGTWIAFFIAQKPWEGDASND
jgi:hypothetical protein